MDIIDAMKARASTRAFLNQAVPFETIRALLEAARFAPSGTNTQPWQVAIVSGKTKQKLCVSLQDAFCSGEVQHPDYAYYPKDTLPSIYQKRRFACGMALYQSLGIRREDKVARKVAWEKNYTGFDAPVILFFFIDRFLEKGSWLDYGMFLQNIMLAALDFELATCAQAALAEYPDIVKDVLGAEYADKMLVAGMALGYPDKTAAVNQYRTERELVDNFTKWFE